MKYFNVDQKEISQKLFNVFVGISLGNKLLTPDTVNDELSGDEKKKEVVERCLSCGSDSTVVMAAEVLDGLKYYKKVGNQEQLENKVKKARIFLDKVEYEGPVFDELREFVGVN